MLRGIALAGVWFCMSVAGGALTAQESPPDEICSLLFQTYVAQQANGAMVSRDFEQAAESACDVIAHRGRTRGFWRTVLVELRKNISANELLCVRILGQMLALDAEIRDIPPNGQIAAMSPALPAEVTSELLERARSAQGWCIPHYVAALAQARVGRTTEFFLEILRQQPPDNPFSKPPGGDAGVRQFRNDSIHTKLLAATGLAQLGHPEGVQWLIAHSEDPRHEIDDRPHPRIYDQSLGRSCVQVLKLLSRQELTTKRDWSEWYSRQDAGSLPRRRIVFEQ